ncbi:MAG: ribosome recycling factor [bacterium]|nr:ribosome recycling factor [bacterium]
MDLKLFEQKLQSLASSLREELQTLRSNRPSPKMVEDIKVDYYGQLMPIKQLGSISIVPPREIDISVWDQGAVNSVAKAIETSSLQLTANIDGNLIRINLPVLTDERRKELDKAVRKMAEEVRIRIRGSRDEINKEIKRLEDAGSLSEDIAFKKKEEAQKFVDKFNNEIESLLANKLREISE